MLLHIDVLKVTGVDVSNFSLVTSGISGANVESVTPIAAGNPLPSGTFQNSRRYPAVFAAGRE
jgi:hypothetical protein